MREKWLVTFFTLALLSTSFHCNIWREEKAKGPPLPLNLLLNNHNLTR